MKRRTTKTLGHLVYTESAERDRYGKLKPGYLPVVAFPVYAIAPKQSIEADETGRKAVITGKVIYAPLTSKPGPHDRFLIDGDTYEVRGEVAVWDDNPHGGRESGIEFTVEKREG